MGKPTIRWWGSIRTGPRVRVLETLSSRTPRSGTVSLGPTRRVRVPAPPRRVEPQARLPRSRRLRHRRVRGAADHWPDAVLSYVVVALAAGFPLVVTLAWVFDVNAGRLERTAPASGLKSSRLGLLLARTAALPAAPRPPPHFSCPPRPPPPSTPQP